MTQQCTVKVSIGLPVFNGMPFLPKTIESILGQTWRDLELIICDNASTDDTEAVCKQFAAQDKRVRYYRNPENIGAAANYNKVVGLSRGEYFKWAAADDLPAPTMIERCIAALEADHNCVLSFTLTVIIDEHGHRVHSIDQEIRVASPDPVRRAQEVWTVLRECNAVFGLVRREVLERTALIGTYDGADGHLLVELALHGTFSRIDEWLFFRREHAAASSSRTKSLRDVLNFYDPKLGERFVMSTWRGFRADLLAVVRASLTPWQRARLIGHMLRRVYWFKDDLAMEALIRGRQLLQMSRAATR